MKGNRPEWQQDVAHVLTWLLLCLPIALIWLGMASEIQEREQRETEYLNWRDNVTGVTVTEVP